MTILGHIQTIFKRIDQSDLFQWFVIAVIVISAINVGAHTYDLSPSIEAVLNALDFAITIFFFVEIIIRYLASDGIRVFFKKGWNIFDVIIVLGSLYPAAGSTIFIARLLRIFRVLRLVSMVPELRVLVNALMKAIPKMGYIGLLMFVIFYIYAAIGSMLFGDINPTLWGDVSISMLTLFRVSTFEDWTDVMYETMEVFSLSWIYYLTFIFLTAFIFLNMMVGTILEVMSEEHKLLREEQNPEENTFATSKEVQDLHQKIDQLQETLSQINKQR